jgi:hypothetical protein
MTAHRQLGLVEQVKQNSCKSNLFYFQFDLQTRLSALPQTGSAPYNRETSGVARASVPMERADPEAWRLYWYSLHYVLACGRRE